MSISHWKNVNSNSSSNQIDRHGCIDIRLESYENVWFDRSKDGAEIEGCSMNCLLHALFISNGYWKNDFVVLPGGIWRIIIFHIKIISCYSLLSSLNRHCLLGCYHGVCIHYIADINNNFGVDFSHSFTIRRIYAAEKAHNF